MKIKQVEHDILFSSCLERTHSETHGHKYFFLWPECGKTDDFISPSLFFNKFLSSLLNLVTKNIQNKLLDQNDNFKNFDIGHAFSVFYNVIFYLLIFFFLLQFKTLMELGSQRDTHTHTTN